jgi:putative DNA primase/helicase
MPARKQSHKQTPASVAHQPKLRKGKPAPDRSAKPGNRHQRRADRARTAARNRADLKRLHVAKEVPLLRKLANAEDEVTSDGFEIYEYRKPLGRIGRLSVPCDEAADPEKVRALLVHKNADILYGVPDAEVIANEISSRPKEFWLNAAHVGWRKEPRAFVLQNRVIGGQEGALTVHPPLWLNDRQRTVIGQEGSLAEWMTSVASPSQYSTRLMFLMSVAFAAPLLEILNRQPFTINLHGTSKVGKTTALLAATSIIGIGSESQLPNWNTTESGFQENARVFNDLIVGANELGLIKGGKKEAYNRIRQLTYWFSEGRDTSRNSASHYAVAAVSSIWRGILVSTAENSFGSLARMAGIDRDAGEYARAHDVTATHSGNRTIFDIKPDPRMNRKAYRRWANKQLRELREGCSQNYGWALDLLIQRIMELDENALAYVKELIKEFQDSVKPLPRDGALRHAVENFGVIYAGGCLAIETNLVPWARETLREAVGSCLQSFLDEAAHQEGVPRRARGLLQEEASKLPLREDIKEVTMADLIGYRTERKNRVLYTIPSKRFTQIFPDEGHAFAALKWLHGTGALRQRRGAGSPDPDNKEWAITYPSHEGKNFRAIQFNKRWKD